MKYIVNLIICVLLLSGVVYAQEEEKGVLNDMPGVKQGMAWDFQSDSIMSLTSVDIVSWDKKLSAAIGGLTDFDQKLIPCISANYKLGNLEQFRFEYPLQQYINIEFGIFGGRDFNEREYVYGVQGSIIKIKL